ncbi:MAG: hypothetical protein ABEH78_02815 [Haloferacaceae archaeon]
MDRSRRDLLRTGGAITMAGLSGCFVGGGCPQANFEMDAASDARIVRAFATTPDELGPLGRRLVRRAIAGKNATYTTTDEDPGLRLGQSPIALDGRYYRANTSVEGTGTTTGYRLTFVANETVRADATANRTITFDELPTADQNVVLKAFLNDLAAKFGGGVDDLPSGIGFEKTTMATYPNGTARERSILLGDTQYDYLTYGNVTVRFTREETVPDVTTTTRRITATRTAPSTAAYLRSIRRRYGVDLDDESLSQKQRTILNEAIESRYGYETCVGEEATLSSDFKELMRMIFEGIDGNYDRYYAEEPRVVRYTGERYLASYAVSVP